MVSVKFLAYKEIPVMKWIDVPSFTAAQAGSYTKYYLSSEAYIASDNTTKTCQEASAAWASVVAANPDMSYPAYEWLKTLGEGWFIGGEYGNIPIKFPISVYKLTYYPGDPMDPYFQVLRKIDPTYHTTVTRLYTPMIGGGLMDTYNNGNSLCTVYACEGGISKSTLRGNAEGHVIAMKLIEK